MAAAMETAAIHEPSNNSILSLALPADDPLLYVKPCHEVFRLMDLPAELRERIYFEASNPSKPICTAASGELIRIPAIAQLNRQTRNEALYVFYRDREIHMDLIGMPEILRATAWIDHVMRSRMLSNTIITAGLEVTRSGLRRWEMKTSCSKEKPQFKCEVDGPLLSESRKVRHMLDAMEDQVSGYLKRRAAAKEGWEKEEGKLKSSEVKAILDLVRKVSGRA